MPTKEFFDLVETPGLTTQEKLLIEVVVELGTVHAVLHRIARQLEVNQAVARATGDKDILKMELHRDTFGKDSIGRRIFNRLSGMYPGPVVQTVAELVLETEDSLLKRRNFGQKCLKRVKSWLRKHGLSLTEREV